MNPQDNSDGMTISNNHVRESEMASSRMYVALAVEEWKLILGQRVAVSQRLCSAKPTVLPRNGEPGLLKLLPEKSPATSLWVAWIGLREHALKADHALKMGVLSRPSPASHTISWCRFPLLLVVGDLVCLSGAPLHPSLCPIDWHRLRERVCGL